MTQGPAFTVMQIGRREGDGRVTTLLTLPHSTADQRYLADRVTLTRLCSLVTGTARTKLATLRGHQLMMRTITGHDELFDEGRLAGATLSSKALIPVIVTEMTQWKELET